MIRSVTIRDIRGIHEGRLDGLTPLVVLVGSNSSGKSTVLDAIALATSGSDEPSFRKVIERRPALEYADQWFFYRVGSRLAPEASAEITTDQGRRKIEIIRGDPNNLHSGLHFSTSGTTIAGTATNQRSNTVIHRPPDPPRHLTRSPALEDVREARLIDPFGRGPQTPLHELYTQVAERGLRREAKAIITDLLPDVEDIEILTQQGQPVVYLVHKNGALPIGSAGDGVRLLLHQSLELAAPTGGVVLLEEPELHLHPAGIRQSARAMLAAMKREIQVIVTTHSLDLIDALLAQISPEDLDKLSVYRLRLNDGILQADRLSGKEAAFGRTEIEDDLR